MGIVKAKERNKSHPSGTLPLMAAVCAIVMIVFSFLHLYFKDGRLLAFFTPPYYGLQYFDYSDIFEIVAAIIGVIEYLCPLWMLIYILLYAKKNIRKLLLPYGVFALVKLISFFLQRLWGVGDSVYGGLLVLTYIIMYGLFALIITQKIKSRMLVVMICFLLVIVAILLSFFFHSPFSFQDENGSTILYLSSLLFFCAYCFSIAILSFLLKADITVEMIDTPS